jgi:hypothetical protein
MCFKFHFPYGRGRHLSLLYVPQAFKPSGTLVAGDVSISMEEYYKVLYPLLKTMARAVPTLAFADSATIVRSSDKQAEIQRKVGGGTCYWALLKLAVELVVEGTRVIFFTDGADGGCKKKRQQAVQQIRERGGTIVPVVFGEYLKYNAILQKMANGEPIHVVNEKT